MADETMLAEACESSEKDRLLALLREHLTVRVEVRQMDFSETRMITVKVDFDGEPIATDFDTL